MDERAAVAQRGPAGLGGWLLALGVLLTLWAVCSANGTIIHYLRYFSRRHSLLEWVPAVGPWDWAPLHEAPVTFWAGVACNLCQLGLLVLAVVLFWRRRRAFVAVYGLRVAFVALTDILLWAGTVAETTSGGDHRWGVVAHTLGRTLGWHAEVGLAFLVGSVVCLYLGRSQRVANTLVR